MTKTFKILCMAIILILVIFQYWVVLTEQKALPSEEWSRSFPTDISGGNYAKIENVPTENGYTISLLDFKKMDVLDCTTDFECVQKWSTSELNPYKNTWTDGQTTYAIKEGSLIRSIRNGETDTIATDVENFVKEDDLVVYWDESQQVSILNGESQPTTYTLDSPIHSAMIVDAHVFILTLNLQENRFTFLDGTNGLKELFQFDSSSSENLSSMLVSSDEASTFKLLLDSEILSGGSRKKVIRTASFDLTENQNLSFTSLKFVEKETGVELSDVRSPSLFKSEQGMKIAFSAYTRDQTGDAVNKIFTGDYEDEVIEASALTKKGDLYIRPTYINDETIAYFKTNGSDSGLMYSSSNEEKVASSKKGLKGDAKEALYTLIGLLFVGLVLVLLAFTWVIPAIGVAYAVLAILQKKHVASAHPVAIYSGLLALFIMQVVMFATAFTAENILVKAPYLSEVWHVYAVLVIAAIGCLLPIWLTRTRITFDNWNQVLMYTMLMNLAILFFLIGPYFL